MLKILRCAALCFIPFSFTRCLTRAPYAVRLPLRAKQTIKSFKWSTVLEMIQKIQVKMKRKKMAIFIVITRMLIHILLHFYSLAAIMIISQKLLCEHEERFFLFDSMQCDRIFFNKSTACCRRSLLRHFMR